MKDFHDLALLLRKTAEWLAKDFKNTNIENVHKLNEMANELEAMRIVRTTSEVVKESLEQVLQTTKWGVKTGRTSAKEVSYSNTSKRASNIVTNKLRDTPTPEQIRSKQAELVLMDEIRGIKYRPTTASPAQPGVYSMTNTPYEIVGTIWQRKFDKDVFEVTTQYNDQLQIKSKSGETITLTYNMLRDCYWEMGRV